MLKTAGVIVLYHPDLNVWENILSYLDDIDILFAVDNSEKKYNSELIEKIRQNPKIKYIRNNENLGIARALNQGAELAIEEGYNWLLTMDQDSRAEMGMIKKMKDWLEKNKDIPVGILSPKHLLSNKHNRKQEKESENVLTVMTSGNLLNLKSYQVCGAFMESLFIDQVDNEYCLRLKKNNYEIIELQHVFLYHKLGNLKQFKFLNLNFIKERKLIRTYGILHHPAVRKYYMTRNALYVSQTYKKDFPQYCRNERINLLKIFFSVIFFEKDKVKKLKAMIAGYRDYKRGKFGKCNGL